MKKLELIDISNASLLSRTQMRSIFAGSTSSIGCGTCLASENGIDKKLSCETGDVYNTCRCPQGATPAQSSPCSL